MTVAEVDRLVVKDDAVAARLWRRFGPRVRKAYLQDRDRWIALRRRVDAGETLPASTLVSERKVFTGWARAFAAARRPGPRRRPARAAATPDSAVTAAAVATTPSLTAVVSAPRPPLPPAIVKTVSAGGAVAGGLVLAGLIAVAARRKRA